MFFGADKAKVVNDALGALRVKIAEDTGQVSDGWQILWVTDFPMFEWDPKAKRFDPLHHPFTSPDTDDVASITGDPGALSSRAYDMVLNGMELGGGSVRIHKADVQRAVLEVLDIKGEDADRRFGFLLDALTYGCPPLGGIAFGLDRLAMLMSGATSIREVIAFPKTQSAADPLTGAPGPADDKQLQELGIRVRQKAD